MKSTFWKNKKVFVTGHTGFKGSWLCLLLKHLGADVYGYALQPPTDPNLFSLARVSSCLQRSTIGDIRDLSQLSTALSAAQPDIVMHLAAQPLLRRSYDIPVETYATNVMGTVHVLESLRSLPSVRAALMITTDKCYENTEKNSPYVETDPMGGFDPYSSSKGCAELAVSAYARSFFAQGPVALATARAGNVIGGGDWSSERLMTDLITALLAGQKPILRNPASVRPWQHVLESLSGYLLAVEYLYQTPCTQPQAWNFGPEKDSEIAVEQVAKLVCQSWGQGAGYTVSHDPQAPHEAALLRLDSTKAERDLHWQSQWDIERSVLETVAWYKAYQKGDDMQNFTLRQIDTYLS